MDEQEIKKEIDSCRDCLDAYSGGSRIGLRSFSLRVVRVIERALLIFCNPCVRHDALWSEGHAFLEECHQALIDFVQRLSSSYPRLQARCFCARAEMLRLFFLWHAIDHRFFPRLLWKKCGRLFQDFQESQEEGVSPHRTDTFYRYFLSTLSIASCSLEALTPSMIHAVSCLTKDLFCFLSWKNTFHAGFFPYHFCFQINQSEKGVRNLFYVPFCDKEKKDPPSCVFWTIEGDIAAAVRRLVFSGSCPHLSGRSSQSLIKFLVKQWQANDEERRLYNRQLVDLRCAGVLGYDSVLSALETDPRAYWENMDSLLHWRIHDMSSNGFGITMPFFPSDSILVHGIIALAFPDSFSWRLCRISRFFRSGQSFSNGSNRSFIGTELLSAQPVLSFFEKRNDFEKTSGVVISLPDYDGIRLIHPPVPHFFLLPLPFFQKNFDFVTFSVFSEDASGVFSHPSVKEVFTDAVLVHCERFMVDTKDMNYGSHLGV